MEQPTIRFLVQSPEKMNFVAPSISPNGKWLALIGLAQDGERRLWVRELGSLKAEPLAGTELVDSMFWSPDSRFIGFFANGQLKTISLRGPPAIVCDAPGSGGSGSWSPQGLILFQTRAHRELYRVAANGGIPEVGDRSGCISPGNCSLRTAVSSRRPSFHLFCAELATRTWIYMSDPGFEREQVSIEFER